MALDDYLFKEKECEPMGNCDFEEDICKKSPVYLFIYLQLYLIFTKVLGKTLSLTLTLIGKLGVVLL